MLGFSGNHFCWRYELKQDRAYKITAVGKIIPHDDLLESTRLEINKITRNKTKSIMWKTIFISLLKRTKRAL
ncbi:MAG: hypothetical protein A2060_07870 [Planctomycetes bacterium GWA2_50_13]|nr:MAG: hypothetical protein A2060_07870 [Planctomycetes bacterium GWA2_50_13]OHB96165.1 MAG: hypothetical protein A3I59_04695 [Planctomycetes bacterium RIFCSPLOWO2_02_FULL_50_16]OHC04709.1 MAG: hypothetical protein A3G17_03970 [Planctomycetes bacterium RIFCSPLOWO2_12_FULL_50_35]HCN19166.1 hypothetical protein [Planctomycetia bacterium]